MTDAHCHFTCGEPGVRELLIGRDFVGIHPWEADRADDAALEGVCARLRADSRLGVGEIGLDRLRDRTISFRQREVFEFQLNLAFELNRPVVLHGAKCWGQVVEAVRRHPAPAFLCHGFSRSDGLIPEIANLGGFISVGPAVLNDHAVNYRELVRKIPLEILILETDRDRPDDSVSIRDVLAKTSELLDISPAELERLTDANAARFLVMGCARQP